MEDVKEKLQYIIAIVLAIIICVLAYYFLCIKEEIYYTKIDNTKIEQIETSDNMRYKYKLLCYNKNGKEKEMEFKTSRILKEDAYLMLEVINLSRCSFMERSFL